MQSLVLQKTVLNTRHIAIYTITNIFTPPQSTVSTQLFSRNRQNNLSQNANSQHIVLHCPLIPNAHWNVSTSYSTPLFRTWSGLDLPPFVLQPASVRTISLARTWTLALHCNTAGGGGGRCGARITNSVFTTLQHIYNIFTTHLQHYKVFTTLLP